MSTLSSLTNEWRTAQTAKAAEPPLGLGDDEWIDILLNKLEACGRKIAETPTVEPDEIGAKLDIALARIAEDEADGLVRNDIHRAQIRSAIDDLRRLSERARH